MAKLEKIIITKKINETAVSAEIKKGTTGHIVKEHRTPENHVCVRFLATELGYRYDPQKDSLDDKYIRIFIPNNNVEVFNPKNTVTSSNTSQNVISSPVNDSEKMEAPWIMSKTKEGWRVVYGHGCHTQKQMEEYIQALDPNKKFLKIMDLSKVKLNKMDIVVDSEEVIEKIEKSAKKKM